VVRFNPHARRQRSIVDCAIDTSENPTTMRWLPSNATDSMRRAEEDRVASRISPSSLAHRKLHAGMHTIQRAR
jgi:hypothetical protein